MNYKQHALKLLGAAALTTATYYVLGKLLPHDMLPAFQDGLGTRGGFVVASLVLLATMVCAGIPAWFLLRWQHVRNATTLTLTATVMAYVLSYALTGVAVSLLGWWAWLASQFMFILVAFLVADLAVNRQKPAPAK
ncbi:hypothetical protein [Frankia sp. Cj3]|uniref:hypothetical protein n=1 Tax=Frankia sp. Cj3 TaxID=2880976 RepID=UPI001EF46396|nr:hypothetical protein [Frankia sp. Cj3]